MHCDVDFEEILVFKAGSPSSWAMDPYQPRRPHSTRWRVGGPAELHLYSQLLSTIASKPELHLLVDQGDFRFPEKLEPYCELSM